MIFLSRKRQEREYDKVLIEKKEFCMKDSVAYCGLFCESCGIYIATKKGDTDELGRLADMLKVSKEEIPCEGCRSSVLSPHCRNCEFRDCATNRQLANCEDCAEFPCAKLKEFQKQAPHRAELFESAAYRKANGIDRWLEKMKKDYACSSCGTINSPYYGVCKNCGRDPGNEFIGRNTSLLAGK
jgi:hypothetical protein